MIRSLLTATALCVAAFGIAAQTTSATGTASNGHATSAAFRCGGVGVDDQDRMKAEAAQHDLLLTFASTTGAYVADVDVRIATKGGVVLEGHCDGPLMLVDLGNKGAYQITASFNGNAQRKNVSVGARPARLSFVWPVS